MTGMVGLCIGILIILVGIYLIVEVGRGNKS